MPQTQPPLQKLPLVKQLTVQRDMSTASFPKEASDKSIAARSEQVQDSATIASSTYGAGSPEQQAYTSLVGEFAGRDAQERTRRSISATGVHTGDARLSKDKQDLIKKLGRDSISAQFPDEYDEPQDVAASDALRGGRSIPILDFNKRMAEQQAKTESNDVESSDPFDEETEENIPSVAATPNKPSPGVVQNAFDRMRPQRTPIQTATITIGDKTTTTVLGPTVSKRQKIIPSPRTSEPSASKASQRFSSSMRSFATPDTQTQATNGSRLSFSPPVELDDQDGSSDSRSITPLSTADISESEQSNMLQPEKLRGSSTVGDEVDDASDESDEDYMDEADKKAKEDAKVAALIQQAEEAAALPSQDNVLRANKLLKGGGLKEATTQLIQLVDQSVERIHQQLSTLKQNLQISLQNYVSLEPQTEPEAESPEERLSLKVSKEDFSRMHIIGQFNLGFILAVRPSHSPSTSDELFIIDQHASDEKYNFERLQANTIVQNQRLVHPHPLDLTAIEEEIILENNPALIRNGFLVDMDTSGDLPVGQRCKLVSLPMSREVTFDTTDLEELIVLLAESASSASTVPRPSRVRKMFAMRACRSSVMIGKSLSMKQMQRLVRQMGEIDKPWNCPHGRPTMRHVLGLGAWEGWGEGRGVVGLESWTGGGEEDVDWRGWMKGMNGEGSDDDGMEQDVGIDSEGAFDMQEEEDEGDGDEHQGDSNSDQSEGTDYDSIQVEEDENEVPEEEPLPTKLNLLGRFGSRG